MCKVEMKKPHSTKVKPVKGRGSEKARFVVCRGVLHFVFREFVRFDVDDPIKGFQKRIPLLTVSPTCGNIAKRRRRLQACSEARLRGIGE